MKLPWQRMRNKKKNENLLKNATANNNIKQTMNERTNDKKKLEMFSTVLNGKVPVRASKIDIETNKKKKEKILKIQH